MGSAVVTQATVDLFRAAGADIPEPEKMGDHERTAIRNMEKRRYTADWPNTLPPEKPRHLR